MLPVAAGSRLTVNMMVAGRPNPVSRRVAVPAKVDGILIYRLA